ncbi:helix-turn-helix domain-containing protein [Gordonia sp. LSe1-13]|uniref:Helix-turn-helix domain-containing protein n=1 Tax=Gordonia sesuvii TaxID=3116777 RepID=A0ABU7MJ22_9ACTN|nr:helix-turn-helix domain-containing protein [Gordonia sp. LSe1-13]
MTTDFGDLWPADDARTQIAGASDTATEERLLEATDRLVGQVGVRRLSMSDVARAAGVSRGTLYRYFESREILLEALRLRTTERFFDGIATAIAPLPTLSAQIGAFSDIIVATINQTGDRCADRHGAETNSAAMIHILGAHGAEAVCATAGFLRPYVASARDRGEISATTDVDDASSWLARILTSFTTFAALSTPGGDARSLSSLVERYAVAGLIGAPQPK